MIRIPNGLSKSETDLYKYLFTKCDELIREGLTIQEAIQSVVTKFAPFVTDEVTLRLFLQSEITVFSDPTIAITTEEVRQDRWWDEQKANPSLSAEYSLILFSQSSISNDWNSISFVNTSYSRLLRTLSC